MVLPKFYNKRLKNCIILASAALIILYSSNIFSRVGSGHKQLILEHQALEYHRKSQFNPRDTSNDLYHYINTHSNYNGVKDNAKALAGSTRIGNESGVYFHWDDWMDLSPADSILDPYRAQFPLGECDKSLKNFADVNGYYLETYKTKVLRGMADLYCLKEIPVRILAPTEHSYVEVPVSGKRRVNYRDLKLNTTKNELLTQMQEFDASQTVYPVTNYKMLKPTIQDLGFADFYLDPNAQINKLQAKEEKSIEEEQYLSFLEYANEYVDVADHYFKYPWILDDVLAGHSHHFAYPFFKRYTSNRERQSVIHHMIRAWFSFAEANAIPSWVNYGSLLGWAYNGVNMPWDTDIDIQIPMAHFDKMGQRWNRTLILEDPRYGNSKYYLVIAPTYIRQGNGKNFIDARFIDTNSGLYIDLSALSYTTDEPPAKFYADYDSREAAENAVPVHCKNWNWHALDELLPIRHAYFEGTSVYIPHNVSRILRRKYGEDSYTTKLHFHEHNYQQDINLWVPDAICSAPPSTPSGESRFQSQDESRLTYSGACGSEVLADEYRIIHEAARRHQALNFDPDHHLEYDIETLRDLPLFRKDGWDYHNDIDTGAVKNTDWYHRQEMAVY